MAGFDAGSVFATLGGRFSSTGFNEFSAAMGKSRSEMEAAEKRMVGSQANIRRSTEALGRAAKVAAVGGVVALGAAIAGSVKVAADFDKAMRNVNSIAGLSEPAFKRLSKSVLELSGKTAQAPKTLAEGLYDLVSSGFKSKDALVILESSAKAATAGLTDTATATGAVAAVLNAYHLKASDAASVSDTLFQTVNRGVITFDVLAHNIGQVLPFASSLGVGLNQVGASISTLTKEGLSGDLAITDLKNAMSSFLKPSKGLAEAIKKTGFESGEALVKAKGFQGALEAVAGTTDGSKKAMAGLFPNIRSLTAALDLTGKSAHMAEGDVKAFGDTAGATQKVFAEQSKSAAFQFQKFKAELQTAGIVIGSAVLPVLNDGMHAIAGFVEHLQNTGQLADFGHSVASGFREAGTVFNDVASAGEKVGGVLLTIGKALDLADPTHLEALLAAFAGFKIAGVVAPLVAGLGTALSKVVTMGRAGYGFGEAAAELGLMSNPLGLVAAGVGLLAGAFVLLQGHEQSEADAAKAVTDAKNAETAAINEAHDAALAAADATFGARVADRALAQSKQHLSAVVDKYGKDSKQYRTALEDERFKALQATEAHKHLADAKKHDNDQTKAAIDGAKKEMTAAKQHIQAIVAHAKDYKTSADFNNALTKAIKDYSEAQGRATQATNIRALREMQLQRLLHGGDLITSKNAAVVSQLAAVYRSMPKDVKTKIDALPQSALAKISDVVSKLHGVARVNAVASIFANTNSASHAVLAFRALVHGVPLHTVSNIIGRTSGKAEVDALNAAIARAHDKTVTLTTYERTIRSVQSGAAHSPGAGFGPQPGSKPSVGRNARGRSAGRGETSLVGEGAGKEAVVDGITGEMRWVTRPTVMELAPQDYVIPTESRYRGRALGLLADLAKSLGVGYAAGRTGVAGVSVTKPTSTKQALGLPIPAKIGEGGVPFSDVEQDRTRIHGDYAQAQKAHKAAHDHLEAERHRLSRIPKNSKGHNYDRSRSNARDAVKQAQKALRAAKAHEKRLEPMATYIDRLWKAAKATDVKGQKFQSEINLDTQYMSDADHKGDQGAYNAARSDRKKQTRGLIALLQRSLSLANPNSAYARSLREQLAQLGGQAAVSGVNPTEANQGSFGGDLGDPEQSGSESGSAGEFTPDEQKRLDDINAAIALAALTGPGSPEGGETGLADDIAAKQSLVDFLGPILTSALDDPAARGGAPAVTDLANQLRSAKEDLATAQAPPDTTADQQAALDQANQRADNAQAAADINAQALAVLSGAGDLGFGPGAAAQRAAGGGDVHLHLESYVPPSPGEARRLAGYVVGGITMQGDHRVSPRERVGP